MPYPPLPRHVILFMRVEQVVDAECTPAQRGVLYASGGVYIVTSRVLIVDLLTKVIELDGNLVVQRGNRFSGHPPPPARA